jgi:drug/metabolite transporter (DMT)-like permease
VRLADYARLVALAAIWGAAFIFMRVAAPVLGAAWTAELRVLLGGLALLAWFRIAGFDPGLRAHWRSYLVVGAIGIAAPFVLYSFAAMHAPASLLAIVNATAPSFGLAWGALFGIERVTVRKATGLALGVAGVVLIARPAGSAEAPLFAWAVAAALGACCLYGVVGVLIKRAAAVVLIPLLPFVPPLAPPSALVIANVLALALLASGVAFILYFRLIAEVGATRALTVTYLIPLFGILWGALFLGEALPAAALAGGALILAGTVLVTRG